MPRNASKSRPDARYTTELVPTMPLPHAPAPAPAPAADVATGERVANARRLAETWREIAARGAEWVATPEAALNVADTITPLTQIIGLQKAALLGAGDAYAALSAERTAALAGLDWSNAERDRLALEVALGAGLAADLLIENAALRGAIAEYRAAEVAMEEEDAGVDANHRYYAARDALSAALSAAPPSAEAVTGAGGEGDAIVKTHPVFDHRGREIGRRLDASETPFPQEADR